MAGIQRVPNGYQEGPKKKKKKKEKDISENPANNTCLIVILVLTLVDGECGGIFHFRNGIFWKLFIQTENAEAAPCIMVTHGPFFFLGGGV
jgi:hypothetical protein